MRDFTYSRPDTVDAALQHLSQHLHARLIAGGTNLLDLMKYQVEDAEHLVDINKLPLDRIEKLPNGGLRIGALARNSDMANHSEIRTQYPVLAEALLSAASAQLRNAATAAGNLLQRTRCYYFYDVGFTECNKRKPGSGCAAIDGVNRIHAILGASQQCIATNPSDMNVALSALEAEIVIHGPRGDRKVAIDNFLRLPGDRPELDNTLGHDELITSIDLPPQPPGLRSYYVKVRDRNSYAFALVSAAVALGLSEGKITHARIALGGVAHKPWRVPAAERQLAGAEPSPAAFQKVAERLVQGAQPHSHNAFKIELARRCVVRALSAAAQRA